MIKEVRVRTLASLKEEEVVQNVAWVSAQDGVIVEWIDYRDEQLVVTVNCPFSLELRRDRVLVIHKV